MQRPEAERLRAQLSSEHPDRATHSFVLSERDGEWQVAKVALPPTAKATGTPTVDPSLEPARGTGEGSEPPVRRATPWGIGAA